MPGWPGCGARRRWPTRAATSCVLEASDRVGGRIRTDRVDGFLVDRGFQLLNPAYPAVRRWVDVDALGAPAVRGRAWPRAPSDGLERAGPPAARARPRPADAARRRPPPAGGGRAGALGGPAAAPATGTVAVGGARAPRRRRPAYGPRPGRRRRAPAAGGRPVLRRRPARGRRQHGRPVRPAADLDVRRRRARAARARAWPRCRPSSPPGSATGCTLGEPVRAGDRHLGRRPTTAPGRRATSSSPPVPPEAAALTGIDAPATKGVATTWWSAPRARRTPTCSTSTRDAPRPARWSTPPSCPAPHRRTRRPGATSSQGSALIGPGRDTDEQSMRRHAGDLLGIDPTGWEVVARHEVPRRAPGPAGALLRRAARCASATSSCAATTATPARSRAPWSAASAPPRPSSVRAR